MKKFFIISSVMLLAGCADSFPRLYYAEMSPDQRKSFLNQQLVKCMSPNIPKDKISDCVNRGIAQHDAGAKIFKRDAGEALKQDVEERMEAGDDVERQYKALNEVKVKCAAASKSQAIICQ